MRSSPFGRSVRRCAFRNRRDRHARGSHADTHTRRCIMRSAAPPFGFRSILCAVDFSTTSAAALRYAAALARSRRARLSVVFAVDPLLSAAAAAAYDARGLTDTVKTELRQFVRTTLGTSAAGPVRLLVGSGHTGAYRARDRRQDRSGSRCGWYPRPYRVSQAVLRIDGRGSPAPKRSSGSRRARARQTLLGSCDSAAAGPGRVGAAALRQARAAAAGFGDLRVHP